MVVNRVLPELFGRGEEEVFDALVDPDAEPVAGGAARPPPWARRCARSSTAPSWRSRCGAPAACTWPGCATSCPTGTPLLYVPYLFQRSHGVRATRQVAEHLAEELGY